MRVEPEHPQSPSGEGDLSEFKPGGFTGAVFETPDLAAETRPLPAAVEADLSAFASYLERVNAAAEANPDGAEARGLGRLRKEASTRTDPPGLGEFLSGVVTAVAAEQALITESSSRG